MATKLQKAKQMLLCMQRHAWEQGTAAQAFLEAGDLNITIQMAVEAASRQSEDGRLAMVGSEHQVTDPAANGEAVLFAAIKTNDPWLKQASDRMLSYLMERAPRTKDGVLHHINNLPQVWSDAAYMAPPFLAAAGEYAEAVRQIEGLRRYLWLPKKQLYAHIWDEGKNDFERKACWGGGNGWTAAGIARILRHLPASMETEQQELAGYAIEVIDGCLVHMQPDGYFHDIVDDPTSFLEVNLGQMIAYAMYRGLQDGWLDKKYKAKADLIRNAAHKKVDHNGLVRDVCGAPTFSKPGISPEAQAFLILMETAYLDLRRSSKQA
jgi:unsaturated rhamnogalacturonyl hydrolase